MLEVLNHTHDGNHLKIVEPSAKRKERATRVFASRISIMGNEVMIGLAHIHIPCALYSVL